MDKTYTSYNNSSKATVLPTMKTTTRKTKSQLAQSGRGWPGTSEFQCCHGLEEDNRDDWRALEYVMKKSVDWAHWRSVVVT